jgi:hypothetical protein
MIRGPRGYLNLYRNLRKNLNYQKVISTNVNELIDNHFMYWSSADHINREGFRKALEGLMEKPSVIIETGTSAWGADSTRLWDSYIRKFGGNLLTCDIRSEPKKQLSGQLSKKSKCIVGDSVAFLRKTRIVADLIYLDSFDLDLVDPLPSAEHGLKEFMAIKDRFKSGTLLLVDDTPSSEFLNDFKQLPIGSLNFAQTYGVNAGKGAFIKKYIEKNLNFELIHHHYSYLIRIL